MEAMGNYENERALFDIPSETSTAEATQVPVTEQNLRIGGVEVRLNPDTSRTELHTDGSGEVDIATVRRLAGAAMPQLPPQWEESWSTDREAHALGLMVNEGLPAPVMQRVLDFYADAVIVKGLNSRTGEDAFRQEFKNVLSVEQQDRLLRWYRENVEGQK